MGRRTFELTVASGGTSSNVLKMDGIFSLSIQGPATLAEVATVKVSNNGTVWDDVDPTSVTVAANAVEEISGVSSAYLKMELGGAAAADRTFVVSAVEYRI